MTLIRFSVHTELLQAYITQLKIEMLVPKSRPLIANLHTPFKSSFQKDTLFEALHSEIEIAYLV